MLLINKFQAKNHFKNTPTTHHMCVDLEASQDRVKRRVIALLPYIEKNALLRIFFWLLNPTTQHTQTTLNK